MSSKVNTLHILGIQSQNVQIIVNEQSIHAATHERRSAQANQTQDSQTVRTTAPHRGRLRRFPKQIPRTAPAPDTIYRAGTIGGGAPPVKDSVWQDWKDRAAHTPPGQGWCVCGGYVCACGCVCVVCVSFLQFYYVYLYL